MTTIADLIVRPPVRIEPFLSQTLYDSEWLRESAAGVNYERGHHYGVDWQDYEGAPLYPVCVGRVRHVDFGPALGYHQFVLIPNGQSCGMFYAHTKTRPPDGLWVGESVLDKPFAQMGHSSSFNLATHLHWELLARWSDWYTPYSPMARLRQLQSQLGQGKEWDEMATKAEIEAVVRAVVREELSQSVATGALWQNGFRWVYRSLLQGLAAGVASSRDSDPDWTKYLPNNLKAVLNKP